MKVARFLHEGQISHGLVEGDSVVRMSLDPGAPVDIIDWIALGAEALDHGARGGARLRLADVTVLAPIVPRKNVYAVGRNYREHVVEMNPNLEPPAHPIFFSKPPTSIIGPGGAIVSSNDPTETADYEGELAVIVGVRGRNIEPSQAWGHIFGYTILNDVTSRALQRLHSQWLIGKGIDTFCPMGPYIVTADEIADPTDLLLTTSVNGELRQRARVSDMVFDIPSLIATLSSVITLEPGDVIATGTPSGVGSGFDPPRYLKPGDLVAVSIDALGTLTNPVI